MTVTARAIREGRKFPTGGSSRVADVMAALAKARAEKEAAR